VSRTVRVLLILAVVVVLVLVAVDFAAKIAVERISARELREADELIGATLVDDDQDVVLVTARGKAIRFPVAQTRPMGRTASGVKGIELKGGDDVVGRAVVDPEADLLTICEGGYAKRSNFADYPTRNRGGQGVRNLSHAGLQRNGPVVGARAVMDGDEIILVTEGGQAIRMQVTGDQFRTMGRNTGGVKAISGTKMIACPPAWMTSLTARR